MLLKICQKQKLSNTSFEQIRVKKCSSTVFNESQKRVRLDFQMRRLQMSSE